MAVDPKNVSTLSGGICAEPEVVGNGIVKLRLAVDYAGQEKDSDNKSGYFDVTYFTSSDTSNAKFVAGQVKDGKLKKGSQVQIVGRLFNERYVAQDGKKASKVVVIAEALTYSGGQRPVEAAEGEAPQVRTQAAVPTEF